MHIQEEAARCLLCIDAPCSKACTSGDPARAIRAVRFGNEKLAGRWVAQCTDQDLEAAEQACIHYDRPIRIKEMVASLQHSQGGETNVKKATLQVQKSANLAITFCGIPCESPFFLASSAICTNYEMVARAFDMGWAGVFYKTICLQEIHEVSPRFDAVQQEGSSDFYAFRNMEQLSENPYEMDFDILRQLKQNYPTKVVVASIMGQTEEQAEQKACSPMEGDLMPCADRFAEQGIHHSGQKYCIHVVLFFIFLGQSYRFSLSFLLALNEKDLSFRDGLALFCTSCDISYHESQEGEMLFFYKIIAGAMVNTERCHNFASGTK